MNSSLWFYSDARQTFGPVAVHQLTAMIQAGQLTAAHFIMPEGGEQWQAVGSSPFAGYLPAVHAATASAMGGARTSKVELKPGASADMPGTFPAHNTGKPQAGPASPAHSAVPKRRLPVALIATVAAMILGGAGWLVSRRAAVQQTQAASTFQMPLPNKSAPSEEKVANRQAGVLPPSASSVEIRTTKRTGRSSSIHFVNKLDSDVEIQFVNGSASLSNYGKVQAGTTRDQHTYGGHVWLITSLDGRRLGIVEGEDNASTVTIDSGGVRQESSPSTGRAAPPPQPADDIAQSPVAREDGEPSRIRFLNKLGGEVKIQALNAAGNPVGSWSLKTGRTLRQRTHVGAVWRVTARDGGRIGEVTSSTERSTVTLGSQGMQVRQEAVPDAKSLLLVNEVQFTTASMGEVVALLRQRAADAGLDVQIELDPKLDAGSGRVTLDARVIPLAEALEACAYQAGARMNRNGSQFRIEPR